MKTKRNEKETYSRISITGAASGARKLGYRDGPVTEGFLDGQRYSRDKESYRLSRFDCTQTPQAHHTLACTHTHSCTTSLGAVCFRGPKESHKMSAVGKDGSLSGMHCTSTPSAVIESKNPAVLSAPSDHDCTAAATSRFKSATWQSRYPRAVDDDICSRAAYMQTEYRPCITEALRHSGNQFGHLKGGLLQ